jgi:2-isopropylmalate synthase
MSAGGPGLTGQAGTAGQAGAEKVEIYDTTLRDGSQQVGLDLTVADKLHVAVALDALGVDVVEGGWPGSNPKDAEFFARAADLPWRHASSRRSARPGRRGGAPPTTRTCWPCSRPGRRS